MNKTNTKKLICIAICILLAITMGIVAVFIDIPKVNAQPTQSLGGSLGNQVRNNCDGKELTSFNYGVSYSVTESGKNASVKMAISASMHDSIKDIANTTSWTKTIYFTFNGETKTHKINAGSSGEIASTFVLESPKYNKIYSMSSSVAGKHGYIFGCKEHEWSIDVSGSFVWSKNAPTLSLTGVTSGGATNSNVTVASVSSDATISYTLNSGTAISVSADGFSKVFSEEGRYEFSIRNNDDAYNRQNLYRFIIDKTAPTGTLHGATNGGYTNRNVYFTWTEASGTQSAIRATLDGSAYRQEAEISTEGTHTLVISDSAGNATTYTFTTDKTKPIGTLNGVANGGITQGNVSFTWSESNLTATLNGKDYYSGSIVSAHGSYTILLSDLAGNVSTYSFIIDKKRPYVGNLEDIKAHFSLSDSVINSMSKNNLGDIELNLGSSVPGVMFTFFEDITALNVSYDYTPYTYNLTTGIYSLGAKSTLSGSNCLTFDMPGEYCIYISDDMNNKLTLRLTLFADITFNASDYLLKGDRYILLNSDLTSLISILNNDYARNMRIIVDDTIVELNTLTLNDFKNIIANKGTREKSARVRIVNSYGGKTFIYYDAYIGYDFENADIHNLDSLVFESTSGSYLGLSRVPITIEFGSLLTEFDESATLTQTLYAYDARNVLVVKDEQTIEYASGLIISSDGYYVLTITDTSGRATVYTFKIMKEYLSANEYSLKNEYFIAPQYNIVKLPLSFGTFNISHHENIADTYIGKYSAEKRYLFCADMNTASEFAFAAEYSVCVQKTSSSYLYRAKNQGIQVAYNSYEQLANKIREVVKEYVSYKSLRVNDSQTIDYNSQIIMDEELKYNGRYENVAPQNIEGVVYDKILLINSGYTFAFNGGRNALSGQATIKAISISSSIEYNVTAGASFDSTVGGLSGLYKIVESYPGSLMTVEYYVYFDNVAPTADISSAKATGIVTDQTVTAADTIVLQVAEFSLKSIDDSIDRFAMVYISGYGFSQSIPIEKGTLANIRISAELGHKGEYTIEVYDRSKNKFSFTLYIMGAAPSATFTKVGTGDSEHVVLNISAEDKYCNIMSLQISRNSVSLEHDSDGAPINSAVFSYIFRQGGRYTIIISDNYERVTTIELRYTKGMPEIAVEGLNKERRVNKDITITMPNKCIWEVTTEKNSTITIDSLSDSSSGKIVITIKPRNEYNELVEIEDKVTVKAWYEADPDSYNDLSYILDTIAPTLRATAENGDLMTGTLFKQAIKFDYDGDVKSIDVQRNGRYFSYTKGQVIRLDGEYIANATDIAGNKAVLQVVLDMTVDYTATYDDNKSYISGIEKVDGRVVTVVKSLMLTANEQISVLATKDGYAFAYAMVDKITASGLYKFVLSDNAGNVATLDYRVLPSVQNISLHTEDGNLLAYNSSTNQSVYFDWDDLSYIKSVSYKGSSIAYTDYVKKDLISKSGNYTATVTDVLSNTLDIRVTVDKDVNIDIKYDKSYGLDEINGKPNTLTKRFAIALNEPNIILSIKLDGEPISYIPGAWLIANGLYEVSAADAVGNELCTYVTVVGETVPNVNITSLSGGAVADKATIKEGFIVAWSDSDYIARVDVNYNRIENGATITADGKYTIDIVDLLDRTHTLTVWIKTKINYTVNYQGSHLISENGIEYLLTRGFSFTSEDSLEIAATRNGESFVFSMYRTYTTAGEYVLKITDIAGNVETIRIRVVETAYLPKIATESGAELSSGAVINSKFEILPNEYISKVLVNGIVYSFGDYISAEGKNKIEVIDVIGRSSVLNVTIDTAVDCDITYGKTYDLAAHLLTDKFRVTLGEPCTVLAKLNGAEFEFKPGTSYITTGLYELTITDSLGNIKNIVVEVDNRTPNVNITNKSGNEILANIINEELHLTWDDLLNIQEVKVNGATVNNGASFNAPGRYEIVIINYLGATATRVINIQDEVIYDLTMRGGSYEYQEDGNTVILTVGFSISGNSIVSVQGKIDGAEVSIALGKTYSVDGLYEVTLTDNAGNTITLFINVFANAIKGGVAVSDVEVLEDISINTSFSIRGHRFIKEIYINGISQILGAEFSAEGIYDVEYVDVLGRRSSGRIVIDKSVALSWEYALIKNMDGVDIYLATALKLTSKEKLTYIVKLDGVLLENFDDTVTFKINGLYHIVARDMLGNEFAFYLRVDNLAPTITAGEPNNDNSIDIRISDDSEYTVEVYLDGKLYLSNVSEFTLKSNGKYTIIAVDELGNRAERSISTDMTVDITCNFLEGQSVNFKPTFSAGEIISYELYCNDTLVQGYKLNDQLIEVGRYKLLAKDELNNGIEITFMYHGNNRKQPLMNYKLPDIEGLQYKVLFEGQPLEIDAIEGILTLSQTGNYTIIYIIDGKEQLHSVDVINTPPKVTLTGNFKSKEDLRTSKSVAIDSACSYVIYLNGVEIKYASSVDKVGKYKIVATDEVGNVSEIEFVIYYAPNAGTVILIIAIGIIGIAIVLFILKRKGVFNKKDTRSKRKKASRATANTEDSHGEN